MPLVNPAPIVYQTLSNEIDARAKKQTKPVADKSSGGLLARSMQRDKSLDTKDAPVERVMHYMKFIRQQREDLKSNA